MKPIVLIYILLPFVAWGVLRDLGNTAHGGAIDLRNRITGVRIAAAEKDPYSYKWTPGESEKFLDPYNEPGGWLSKTTVTPWMLFLHAPFQAVNYRSTQWFWYFAQYGALIAGVLLWRRLVTKPVFQWGLLICLCYILTPAWRHHVDHGQIYVFYALAFFVFSWFDLRGRGGGAGSELLAGGLAAFALGCRPVFPAVYAVFLPDRRWVGLASGILGLGFVFIIPILLFGPFIWTQYRDAMAAHAEQYLNQIRPERVRMSLPATIEGMPLDQIARFSNRIPFADTSLYRTISFAMPVNGLLLGWLLAMGISLLVLVKKRVTAERLWFAIIAWIVVGDFLLPAFRHTYNDVLFLPAMLLGLLAWRETSIYRYWMIGCFFVLTLMVLGWQYTAGWFLAFPSLVFGVLALCAVIWTTLSALRDKPGEI